MKKLGIAIAGLVAVALVLFFTFGSSGLRSEAKKQLNKELLGLRQNGFNIEDRISKESEDHFILTFKEPKKIAHYFTEQGTPVTTEEIASLKGMKLGVDVYYLKDTYSAISADLYPVKLPDDVYANTTDPENKALLEQVQKMLDAKKLLLHVDIAKDFTHFKGYMKDIDETFKSKGSLTIQTKGLIFSGETKDDRITLIDQKLETVTIIDDTGGKIILSDITTQHKITGSSIYDMDANYRIGHITIKQDTHFSGEISDIHVSTSETVTDNLLQSHVDSTVKAIQVQTGSESLNIQTLHWDVSLDNVDISALETLQKLDPNKDEAAIQKSFTQLLNRGIKLTLNNLSVKEIIENGKSLGGLSMRATFGLDRKSDLTLAQQNPLLLLSAIDAKMTLKVSNTLFAVTAQDPRAMMLIMMIPPKDENGQKVYTVIMKNGKTTVNGVSF